MIPVPAIAFPIALLATLLLSGGAGFWGYNHGVAVQEARQTKVELQQANKALADATANNKIANEAGQQHEQGVKVVHDTTREIVRTVTIPPDADPYLPVWFVRLFDRFASRTLTGDPYPGKSDSAPSDVRLSEARTMLGRWADEYYVCRQQVIDIGKLNPVLPPPPEDRRGLFDKLNPF